MNDISFSNTKSIAQITIAKISDATITSTAEL